MYNKVICIVYSLSLHFYKNCMIIKKKYIVVNPEMYEVSSLIDTVSIHATAVKFLYFYALPIDFQTRPCSTQFFNVIIKGDVVGWCLFN